MWGFFNNIFFASILGFVQFGVAFWFAGYYEYHANSGDKAWIISTCIPAFVFFLVVYSWTDSLFFSSMCYVVYVAIGFTATQWGLESYLKLSKGKKHHQ